MTRRIQLAATGIFRSSMSYADEFEEVSRIRPLVPLPAMSCPGRFAIAKASGRPHRRRATAMWRMRRIRRIHQQNLKEGHLPCGGDFRARRAGVARPRGDRDRPGRVAGVYPAQLHRAGILKRILVRQSDPHNPRHPPHPSTSDCGASPRQSSKNEFFGQRSVFVAVAGPWS